MIHKQIFKQFFIISLENISYNYEWSGVYIYINKHEIYILINMKFIFTYFLNYSFSGIQDYSVVFSTFIPLRIYPNVDTDKSKILSKNKR